MTSIGVFQHWERGPKRLLEAFADLSVRLSKYHKWFFLLPVVIFMLAFFAAPLAWMVRVSFYEHGGAGGYGRSTVRFYVPDTFTWANYVTVMTDAYFRGILLATLKITAAVTTVTMLIAYPFSVYMYKARGLYKALLLFFVALPKLTNVLILLYGIIVMLARNGFVNRFLMFAGLIQTPLPMFANLFSVVVGQVLLVVPYPILILVAFLHGLDPNLEEAARGMGASRLRAFWEITFPLSLPSGMAALLITLIWALGAFVTPMVLGNPDLYTLAIEAQHQTFDNVNWAMGATVSVCTMFIVMIFVILFLKLQSMFEVV